MKAWFVWDIGAQRVYQEGDPFYGCVVHAETASKAKSKGAREIDWHEDYVDLRVRREPAMDGKPITPWNLVSLLSWRYECWQCATMVSLDDEDLEPCQWQGYVFCSPSCRSRWHRVRRLSCQVMWVPVLDKERVSREVEACRQRGETHYYPTKSGFRMVPVPTAERDKPSWESMYRMVQAFPNNTYYKARERVA